MSTADTATPSSANAGHGSTGKGDGRPLRILHIGKYFAPHRGGMETFLRDLMAEQQRQGLAVHAIVHRSERSLRSRREVREEQAQSLPLTRVARWCTLSFAPISPTFPQALARDLRTQHPDILHIHMPNLSAFWCLLLPRARQVPWVVHWHADVLASRHSRSLRFLYGLYRPFEQALLRRAARIIVTSPPYLASSEPLASHQDKSQVIPLGIVDLPEHTLAEAAQARERDTGADLQDEVLRVLWVGRLTYYKGLCHLIEAVAALEGVELTIVGSGDEDVQLRALVRRHGAEDRITFTGALPDEALQKVLANCDCLCLSSIERTEAFGVVLLEAMRAGKAAVATAVQGSGMSWVLEDGLTGLVVGPENAAALTAALRTLRDDPLRRVAMGHAGRQRFETHFCIDQTNLALTSVYRSLRS